jgi:hypothetical protein
VRQVAPNEAGGYTLLLAGGEAVEVSRRRAAAWRELAVL